MTKKQKKIERIIEYPARTLDKSLISSQKITNQIPVHPKEAIRQTKKFWFLLGPGLTTGASDDDPSGIATYSQTGAQTGFSFLWLALWILPFMIAIQEMCARIGMVTGRGLSANIKAKFNPKILYFATILLFIANTFNIGADIGAMAAAIQLLEPKLHFVDLAILITVIILMLQIFTSYIKYARLLKYLSLILFTYVASALLSHLNYHHLLSYAIVPSFHFQISQLILICAILGTSITPYLFFWQTSQEIEDKISSGQATLKQRQEKDPKNIKKMRIDVWTGMFLSNLVMFFIITACASVLFKHGIFDINTAAQAAQALKPFAGNATFLLFSIGIIGVGLLAIPVMAGSSAYAISEAIGKKNQGLNLKLNKAYDFYGVIILSMIIGLSINFIGLNPIKALIYSAVLNGIIAPIIIVLIILISKDRKIMGKFKNSKFTSGIGWILTFFMSVSGIAAIYALITTIKL